MLFQSQSDLSARGTNGNRHTTAIQRAIHFIFFHFAAEVFQGARTDPAATQFQVHAFISRKGNIDIATTVTELYKFAQLGQFHMYATTAGSRVEAAGNIFEVYTAAGGVCYEVGFYIIATNGAATGACFH